ncbi:MAG: GFA family protein [Rhodospirillales bacterium]
MSIAASDVKIGGCLCGGVRFQVSGPLRDVVSCHCTLCRKATTQVFAATKAWLDDMALLSDATLRWYRSGPNSERGFCGTCGAALFFRVDGSDQIAIGAGSIDGETGLKTAAHIYVADKGDYYDITDGRPCFDADDDLDLMPPRKAD